MIVAIRLMGYRPRAGPRSGPENESPETEPSGAYAFETFHRRPQRLPAPGVQPYLLISVQTRKSRPSIRPIRHNSHEQIIHSASPSHFAKRRLQALEEDIRI